MHHLLLGIFSKQKFRQVETSFLLPISTLTSDYHNMSILCAFTLSIWPLMFYITKMCLLILLKNFPFNISNNSLTMEYSFLVSYPTNCTYLFKVIKLKILSKLWNLR